jgi:hypothetical protein
MRPQHKELSMKRVLNLFPILVVLGLFFFSVSFSAKAHAETPDKTFVSRTAEISDSWWFSGTLAAMISAKGAQLRSVPCLITSIYARPVAKSSTSF